MVHTAKSLLIIPSNPLKITNSKKAEATGHLIGNKIADAVVNSFDCRFTKFLKKSPQNSSEIVKDEHNKEIPKEIYLQKKKQKIIDDLKLIKKGMHL